MHFETLAVQKKIQTSPEKENCAPLFLSSSFVFDNADHGRALFAGDVKGNIYSRFTNPNCREFEEKISLLEGTEDACAMSSGMAAIFACFATFLNQGDHILSSRSIFGSTHKIFAEILPRWGIEISFANVGDHSSWEDSLRPNTKMIFAETPTNPRLDIVDLEWLGNLARTKQILLTLDNTFATPYLQQPIQFGCDLIAHSGTKFLDGQGRVVAGVVAGKQELIDQIRLFGKITGPALSPLNAWILSKSIETLAVRMDRHCETALQLAQYLENHEEVEYVIYPFLKSHPNESIARNQMKKGGGLVSFEVKGGLERGKKFLDSLSICALTANLGDTKSIVTHPASTTHASVPEEAKILSGITDGLIRISVGLENIGDIVGDFERAFAASKI